MHLPKIVFSSSDGDAVDDAGDGGGCEAWVGEKPSLVVVLLVTGGLFCGEVDDAVVADGLGVMLLSIMRSTADVVWLEEVKGGFLSGRQPRGPDPTRQLLVPPRMLSWKVLNAEILSDGTSSALTWLDLW